MVGSFRSCRGGRAGAADAALGCAAGSTSFAIDLPNAGNAMILGNNVIQGPATLNNTMLAYGEEGEVDGFDNVLLVEDNAFTNTAPGNTIGLNNATNDVNALLLNDTFDGVTTPLAGPGTIVNGVNAFSEPSSFALLLMVFAFGIGLFAVASPRCARG